MMFYKETNFKGATVIGKIPMSWEMVRIQEICEFKRGFSYRSDQITKEATNTRFITINDYEKEGGFKQNSDRLYLKDDVDLDSNFILDKDDVLIANTDMSRGFIIGAPIHIESMEGKLVYSMDLTKLFFDKNKMNGKFLFYFLKHEKVRRKMKTFAQGTNVLHLNHELVKSLLVPLPSLSEQLVIAGVLSVVDLAVGKTDEVIAKTERLKKGLMQELLTRGIGHKEYKQTPTGKIPKEWNVTKLQQVATVRYGLGQPPELDDNGIPMIRATNIKRGSIIETGLLRVKHSAVPNARNPYLSAGDVIVVRSGAYTGDIGYVSKKWEGAVAGYDLIVSPSNNLDSMFLTHYLLSTRAQVYFSQLKSRSAQPHLNSEQVSETPIPLPPLQEQQRIASILSKVDEKLELEKAAKERFERIKRGLMDLLLTGKIRVKVD